MRRKQRLVSRVSARRHGSTLLGCRPPPSERRFAGTKGNGVLRSEDHGKTWHPSGMQGQVVKAIAVSPVEPIWLSRNQPPALSSRVTAGKAGRNWSRFAGCGAGSGSRLPKPATRMYRHRALAHRPECARGWGRGWRGAAQCRWRQNVARSSEGAVRDCHALTFHGADGHWVYEAGGTGAAFSRDAGATVAAARCALAVALAAVHARGGGVHPLRAGWTAATGLPSARTRSAQRCGTSPPRRGPFKAHGEGSAEASIYRKSGEASWEARGRFATAAASYALRCFPIPTQPDICTPD